MKSKLIGLSITGFLAISVSVTEAARFPDGTVTFEKSPRLLDAQTTFSDVDVWGAKYYFILNVPADAGEPLGKVTIRQREGQEDIRFRVDETFAFAGTPDGDREELTLQDTRIDEETNTISVVFEQPVPPGTTLSIGLKPRRNPEYDGVYLFGITAFPAGEKSLGLELGIGRLEFYRNGSDID